jgi:hypothetical protein
LSEVTLPNIMGSRLSILWYGKDHNGCFCHSAGLHSQNKELRMKIVSKSWSAFWGNVLHAKALPIIKHKPHTIMNLHIHRSWHVQERGFLRLLLMTCLYRASDGAEDFQVPPLQCGAFCLQWRSWSVPYYLGQHTIVGWVSISYKLFQFWLYGGLITWRVLMTSNQCFWQQIWLHLFKGTQSGTRIWRGHSSTLTIENDNHTSPEDLISNITC